MKGTKGLKLGSSLSPVGLVIYSLRHLSWAYNRSTMSEHCVFAFITSATKDVPVWTVLLLTLDIPTLRCSVHNS